MDNQVRSVLLLILLASVLGGCSGERSAPLLPEPPRSQLTILADGVEIASFERREGIEWLCTQLPPREYEQLLAEGSCTTTDPGFKAAVLELLGREPEARRGFAGLNPRVVTWGQIKVRYS